MKESKGGGNSFFQSKERHHHYHYHTHVLLFFKSLYPADFCTYVRSVLVFLTHI